MPVAFSPDGRLLAFAYSDVVQLYEVTTWREVRTFNLPGKEFSPQSLAFSPDGKYLATGHLDTTILLWDMTGLNDRVPRPVALTPAELDALWADLAGDDARKAYRAIYTLAADGPRSVPFLRERLRTVAIPADAD